MQNMRSGLQTQSQQAEYQGGSSEEEEWHRREPSSRCRQIILPRVWTCVHRDREAWKGIDQERNEIKVG